MSDNNQTKDPGESLNYSIDWTQLLAGVATVAASSWALETNGTATLGDGTRAPTFGDSSSTAWLIGGEILETAVLTCTMTTSDNPPEIHTRSIDISIAIK